MIFSKIYRRFASTSTSATPFSKLPSQLTEYNYKPNNYYLAKVVGATGWFFLMYRFYHDGGHHFLGHHDWDDPEVVCYLESVDAKYPGSRLSVDNIHLH